MADRKGAVHDSDVLLHQGLVRAIAWKIHRRVPRHVEIDDLIAYGQVGLLQAIRTYDPSLGRKFVTFAWHRIRGAILDGLGSMAWFDRVMFERGVYESGASEAAARAESAGGPSGEQAISVAAKTGTSRRDCSRPVWNPLDAEQLAGRDERPDRRAQDGEMIAFLRLLISTLPEREAALLHGVFFEGRTLTEAARRLGISTAWASRLQARTLADLRVALERNGFD
jgi:RNA polymerase sigma factor for flagellar operon FliA